jgi:hypothetical protein
LPIRADTLHPQSVTNARGQVITLVVRLWFERSEVDTEASEWRGEIKRVPSGEVSYFRGLADLSDHLRTIVSEQNGAGV